MQVAGALCTKKARYQGWNSKNACKLRMQGTSKKPAKQERKVQKHTRYTVKKARQQTSKRKESTERKTQNESKQVVVVCGSKKAGQEASNLHKCVQLRT